MSVQFAKDEKVIKSFNYAAVGYNKKKGHPDTFKSLIVTNTRVIHEAVREKRSNELIIRQEMPVADAKYVKTTMGKASSPELLVQAIVFFVIAALAIVVSTFDFAEKFRFALTGGHQPGKHPHSGGFSAAIGAEKSENFPLTDFETHMIDRRE